MRNALRDFSPNEGQGGGQKDQPHAQPIQDLKDLITSINLHSAAGESVNYSGFRIEQQGEKFVAVFENITPVAMYGFDGHGRTYRQEHKETRFDKSTLELRISNLEREGNDASFSRKALIALTEAEAQKDK